MKELNGILKIILANGKKSRQGIDKITGLPLPLSHLDPEAKPVLPWSLMELEEKLRANFAVELVRRREAKKLSQAALVAALNEQYEIGLTRTALANYESGKAFPKIATLYALARHFGTSIEALLGEAPTAEHLLPSPTLLHRADDTHMNAVHDTDLTRAYIQELEIHKFYVAVIHNLLQEVDQPTAQLIKRIYLTNLLSKSRAFIDHLDVLLDSDERAVFQAIHSGSSIALLAELRQVPETEILRLFSSARRKVLDSIEKTQP